MVLHSRSTSRICTLVSPVELTEYGCSKLSLATITRDRRGLASLLQSRADGKKALDVNDTMAAPYSPLCFAIGWPEGMGMLLGAGADPSTAIHCAIRYGDGAALEVLLDHGSNLYAPSKIPKTWFFWHDDFAFEYGQGMLVYALTRVRAYYDGDRRIVRLIIESLARRRRRLMALAKKHLSIQRLRRLGWKDPDDDHALLDSAAPAVFNCLQELGVEMSETLRPRPRSTPTVYHNVCLTVESAEILHSVGFHEVDLADTEGQTPLLLYSLQGNFSCIEWFLERGATQMIFGDLNQNSIVHVIAAYLAYWWGLGSELPHDFPMSQLSGLLTKISSVLPLDTRDKCHCFCSDNGCSPITALLKHAGPWMAKYRKRLLRLWKSCLPSQEFRQLDYADICRFEFFERLEMKHTCCRFDFTFWRAHIRVPEPSEITEFQEEDEFARQQLDALMELFGTLQERFHESFDQFWQVWWDVMEEFVPSLPLDEDEEDSTKALSFCEDEDD